MVRQDFPLSGQPSSVSAAAAPTSENVILVDASQPSQSITEARIAAHAGVDCLYSCTTCLKYFHQIPKTPMSANQEFGPVGCGGYDCPEPTHECNPIQELDLSQKPLTPKEMQEVWTLVAHNDIGGLRRFLATHRRVELNVSRSALQVVGCQNSIVSNLPITATQVRELSE